MKEQELTVKDIANRKRNLTNMIKALKAEIDDIIDCAEKQNYLDKPLQRFWYHGEIRTKFFIERLQDQLEILKVRRSLLDD